MAAVSHEDKWGLGAVSRQHFLQYNNQLLQQQQQQQQQGNGVMSMSFDVGSSAVTGGDYQVRAHEVITSSQSVYEVLELLGKYCHWCVMSQ